MPPGRSKQGALQQHVTLDAVVTHQQPARQAAVDLQRGQTGDLATLNLQYRRVIAEVMDLMPKSIQDDAQVLLASLCDPLPTERLARSPYHRDRHLEPLEWVLRRADIMIRRLEIDAREERRIARKLERAAS